MPYYTEEDREAAADEATAAEQDRFFDYCAEEGIDPDDEDAFAEFRESERDADAIWRDQIGFRF